MQGLVDRTVGGVEVDAVGIGIGEEALVQVRIGQIDTAAEALVVELRPEGAKRADEAVAGIGDAAFIEDDFRRLGV